MNAPYTPSTVAAVSRSVVRRLALLLIVAAIVVAALVVTLTSSGAEPTSGIYHPFRDGYLPAQPM